MPPICALLGGFAIGARVALLWQHYGNVWQSLAVIHPELDTDWMHPWIGLDWIGLDWIGSNV